MPTLPFFVLHNQAFSMVDDIRCSYVVDNGRRIKRENQEEHEMACEEVGVCCVNKVHCCSNSSVRLIMNPCFAPLASGTGMADRQGQQWVRKYMMLPVISADMGLLCCGIRITAHVQGFDIQPELWHPEFSWCRDNYLQVVGFCCFDSPQHFPDYPLQRPRASSQNVLYLHGFIIFAYLIIYICWISKKVNSASKKKNKEMRESSCVLTNSLELTPASCVLLLDSVDIF